ncbi:lipopolysaccharide-binding protein-like [Anneissia japonica]|uniref:lipopolysaccharide-binding protein-like n=1 Tax=Anneissia japonica TaxID=1529436 RepID=UPI001425A2F5|nr:lipopolysaccharide-binding protein-like [Anneissia japonica]
MNRRLILGVVVLVTLLTVVTESVNPGLQMKITQNGLQYVSKIGVQLLKKTLADTKIPDISGDTNVDVIGHVSYELKNMKITSFDLPDASIGTVSDTGLKASIVNARLSIHGDWSYHNHGFIHISDHGSIDVTASSISLSLVIQIGNSNGHFAVSTTNSDCNFHVGSLDVDFHGGASWLYNLFKGTIADSIQDDLNKQMCDEIIEEVNGKLAEEIANIKLVADIDDYAYVDYSLVSSPKFSSQDLKSFHKGEILSRKDHQDVPVPAPPIPADNNTSSRMLYLWLTEYVSASAAYVYYKSGVLQYNVTNDMVPPPFSLNTSRFPFSNAIPQIGKHFPNLNMTIDGKITKPPVLNMTSAGLKGGMVGQLDFYAIEKNKTLIFLFSLSVAVNLSAKADVNTVKKTITANFTLNSYNLKLIESSPVLGDISADIKNLNSLMNMLFNFIVLPELNKKGSEGLPIPSDDGFDLVKPSIDFGEGFIRIATDINYTVAT